MFKKLASHALTIAALVVVGSLVIAPAAYAQSGAVAVGINMPGVIVLHYFSQIDVTVPAGDIQTLLGLGASVDQGTKAVTAASLSGNAGLTPTAANSIASVDLTLLNAWAVRAIGIAGGASVNVAIAVTDATLGHTGLGTETITINSAAVKTGASAFGASVAFASPGFVTAALGDVRLNLNLENATLQGDYTTGQYTLTVTLL